MPPPESVLALLPCEWATSVQGALGVSSALPAEVPKGAGVLSSVGAMKPMNPKVR